MVDTLNVTRQMERNATLGISDFYLVEHLDGKVEFAGTMDLERVLDLVKSKVLVTKSCDMWAWVPDQPLPPLPASLDKVGTRPFQINMENYIDKLFIFNSGFAFGFYFVRLGGDIRCKKFWDFPRKHRRDPPPSKCDKTIFWSFTANF